MDARYVFTATVVLEPETVTIDPDRIEVRIYRDGDPPGESGWLFFRDTLWRGEINDKDHMSRLLSEDIGAPIDQVSFRAFEVDCEYYEAFREAIAGDLDEFRAESVSEVINKYLGSRLEVAPADG